MTTLSLIALLQRSNLDYLLDMSDREGRQSYGSDVSNHPTSESFLRQ